ncbi:FadR/GntR family transcriptional regulator [Streptomyces malaysiensis subsp. malaysiensis]|uniref:FadR/GntR family transcriptional regulator n=1 Tax=Streptomyces malaysiensis TaxID=92644 RepID=UPI0024BF3B78|nr:FadR/GntR family transcriptional regulator [Streptomyces sp. NA07423]WHX22049.1 FadR/GntR family transcriptional regulator [Streptomyces sp. NA07423]
MSAGLTRVERVQRDAPALQVARQLLGYLLESGKAQVGQKLPAERELVETFGVGRSSVREALKSLSLLGLLEIRQGDGTYVRNPSSDLLPQVIEWGLMLSDHKTAEMIEARLVIEVAVAEFAAARRTEEDLADLERHLRGMKDSVDSPQDWVEHDMQFHFAVARASHNGALADYLLRLRSLLGAWIKRNQETGGSNADKYEEHHAVYVAIRDQDATAAGVAMRRHINRVATRLDTSEATEAAG